ncbi:MAG: peptidoglycan-binding protein [Acidobacteria bacterium]|nr:peptidoglycan-binding protein [Acidobacteriota bacterium]
MEIQRALAEAGYYSGTANGIGGDASITALKQFQQDQGLEPTGKIDALTLIRLDLGLQYESPEEAVSADAPSPG